MPLLLYSSFTFVLDQRATKFLVQPSNENFCFLARISRTVLSIYGSTILLLNLGLFFNLLISYKVGRTPWTGDQSVARPQTRNKCTQASMP
jgi:hypothetical protein